MNARKLVVGGLYRHVRTRNLYRVVGSALSAEDLTVKRVIYKQVEKSLSRDGKTSIVRGTMWSREEHSFLETFSNGKERFEYVFNGHRM